GSPVQEQSPLRQLSIRSLRHLLKALALKPGHAAATSSEHTFGLHSFPGGWTALGLAVASETKPPAQSVTATTVTTAFLVIVEPPMSVSRSISTLAHACRSSTSLSRRKVSQGCRRCGHTDAEKNEARGSRRTRGFCYAPEAGSSRL